MSWSNKGDLWELDHAIPISKFNLDIIEHKNICFHWCNLRPIYKSENRKKSNKIDNHIIDNHKKFSFNFSQIHNLNYINISDFNTL